MFGDVFGLFDDVVVLFADTELVALEVFG